MVAFSAQGSVAASASKVKIDLVAAAVAPAASGRALAVVRGSTKGRFEVRVKHLAANTSYDLLVGGVKVATLQTNNGGSAKARFSSKPNGKDLLLGFDPRGDSLEVRDDDGSDVLTGNLPENPSSDPGDVTCCIPDDSGAECEDRTQAECTARGGIDRGAGACTPTSCDGL